MKMLWHGKLKAVEERSNMEYMVLGEHKLMVELIKTIVTTQGLQSFWKGILVNILCTAPFKAVNICAYDDDIYRKKQLLRFSMKEEATNFERFIVGAAAGVTVIILCTPLDTHDLLTQLVHSLLYSAEDINWFVDWVDVYFPLAVAGACAQAVTYPFEVVMRQLQLQVATCIKIFEHGGIPALYAGFIPRLPQVLTSAAISYFVYQFMKIVLK